MYRAYFKVVDGSHFSCKRNDKRKMGNKSMVHCVACDCAVYEDDVKDPRAMSPMLRRVQEEQNSYASIEISKEKKKTNKDHQGSSLKVIK